MINYSDSEVKLYSKFIYLLFRFIAGYHANVFYGDFNERFGTSIWKYSGQSIDVFVYFVLCVCLLSLLRVLRDKNESETMESCSIYES